MSTLYCAHCGDGFEPDDEYVWIDAEHRLINDANRFDEYAMHRRCWLELTDDWSDPA